MINVIGKKTIQHDNNGNNDNDDHGGHDNDDRDMDVETLHATSLQPQPSPQPPIKPNKNETLAAISPKQGSFSTIIRSYKLVIISHKVFFFNKRKMRNLAWWKNYCF